MLALSLSLLSAPIGVHDQTPNLSPFPQHTTNLHLKLVDPLVSINLAFGD